jgi:hypothetical protein
MNTFVNESYSPSMDEASLFQCIEDLPAGKGLRHISRFAIKNEWSQVRLTAISYTSEGAQSLGRLLQSRNFYDEFVPSPESAAARIKIGRSWGNIFDYVFTPL